MKPRRPDSPPRKPRRRWRWHVPPAIVHGPEALEGTEVLDEIGGELGLVFWQSLRDISLWSSIHTPEERAGLFSAQSGQKRAASLLAADPEDRIAAPLAILARILEDPAGTPVETVTQACREISDWANDKGMLATALAFAQAASLASPTNAAAAYKVGLLARRRGEDARAETWFRRTIGLARQGRDWDSYSKAFRSLGVLYSLRGNLPVARQHQIRSFRAAKRHSLRPAVALALHEMFNIAVRGEQHAEAEALARAAYEAYDPDQPEFVAFAHDVAYFWMSLGQFAPALTVFQALAAQIRKPQDRLLLMGSIARAAGGVGDPKAYAEARDEIWRQAGAPELKQDAPDTLLDLARGTASLSRWAEAEEAARTALQVATDLKMAMIAHSAQAVLEAVQSERAVEAGAVRQVETTAEADHLATDLVRTLEEHATVG